MPQTLEINLSNHLQEVTALNIRMRNGWLFRIEEVVDGAGNKIQVFTVTTPKGTDEFARFYPHLQKDRAVRVIKPLDAL